MYELISSAEDSDDVSIGFDRSLDRRKQELTKSKNRKRKNLLQNLLKDVFGFAEHQRKATCGLGYKLTLTGNEDDAAIGKAEGIADARIKIDQIHWYVRHFTPSIQHKVFYLNFLKQNTYRTTIS